MLGECDEGECIEGGWLALAECDLSGAKLLAKADVLLQVIYCEESCVPAFEKSLEMQESTLLTSYYGFRMC